MSRPAAPSSAMPAAVRAAGIADAVMTAYREAGYQRVAPAILQPAEPFLDLSGEDIRRSLYLTTDENGAELCLRPDLTIPVARDYLFSPLSGQSAGFCYLGPVFRSGESSGGEFLQGGIESFGRTDRTAADAEILGLGLEAAAAFGLVRPVIRAGDVALFAALIEALALAPAWRRRLMRDFHRKRSLARDLAGSDDAGNPRRRDYEGVLAALAGSDRSAALALVTDLMTIAGAGTVGGRSVAEIADRFLEQSTLAGDAFPDETRGVIARFLAVQGTPDAAATALRRLATDSKLDLSQALDQFEDRTRLIAARGIDPNAIRFATAFGRGLDYYTGLEFEVLAHDDAALPVVAGGRYDDLMSRLGASVPIPAVGCALWIARLASATGDL